jgi:hypothetical protein
MIGLERAQFSLTQSKCCKVSICLKKKIAFQENTKAQTAKQNEAVGKGKIPGKRCWTGYPGSFAAP